VLGKKIREKRISLGLTQQSLADNSNLDISSISKIENNRATPSLKALERIAKALDTSIIDLLNKSKE
jgi:transcriptional regulator with XRE-family HTH domain